MFKHILVPTDGSDRSEQAARFAVDLAKVHGARVTGIHVVPDFHLMIAYEGAFDPAVGSQRDRLAGADRTGRRALPTAARRPAGSHGARRVLERRRPRRQRRVDQARVTERHALRLTRRRAARSALAA